VLAWCGIQAEGGKPSDVDGSPSTCLNHLPPLSAQRRTFPIAKDMPIYQSPGTNTDSHLEENPPILGCQSERFTSLPIGCRRGRSSNTAGDLGTYQSSDQTGGKEAFRSGYGGEAVCAWTLGPELDECVMV
jgi:hypothetical protein